MKEDIENIKKAAEQGDSEAKFNLGIMYAPRIKALRRMTKKL